MSLKLSMQYFFQHQDNIYDGKMTKSFKGDTEKTNHYKDVKNFYDPFKLIPSDSFTDEKCVCTFNIYITSMKRVFIPNFYFQVRNIFAIVNDQMQAKNY